MLAQIPLALPCKGSQQCAGNQPRSFGITEILAVNGQLDSEVLQT